MNYPIVGIVEKSIVDLKDYIPPKINMFAPEK